MIKDRLLAIAGGAVSALLLLSIVGALVAQLPILLAGFTLGIGGAVISGAVAAIAVALALGPITGLAFALQHVFPALLVTWLALRSHKAADGTVTWSPPGLIVGWLSAVALAGVLVISLTGSSEDLAAALKALLGQAVEKMTAPPSEQQIDRSVRMLVTYYPGVVAMTVMWISLANAALAQRLAVQTGRNIRPTPRYSSLDLPVLVGSGAAAAALGMFLSGDMGIFAENALIVLLVPFLFQGLAVIHAISIGWPGRGAVLVLLYLIILLFGVPTAPVAALGILEPYLQLRRRFANRGQGRENE